LTHTPHATLLPYPTLFRSIRLVDAQNGFRIGGTGIVAVIDTGVDTKHPVLYAVLLPGYDFTRNQPGASEWLDVSGLESGYLVPEDRKSTRRNCSHVSISYA